MEKPVSVRILHVLGTLLIAAACLEGAHGSSYLAFCGLRPTVVRIDHPQYRYYPFFVTLHRCDGSCSTRPSNQLCSPTADEEVKIQLFDITKNEPAMLVMKNHTTCKCMCVASRDSCRLDVESWEPGNCRCKCRYPNGPPEDQGCQPGFRWNGDICRCQCNLAPEICPPNKVWSEEKCGCVCSNRVIKRCERKGKGLDTVKCECVDVQALLRRDPEENRKTTRMFITLLVGQGFLLVVIICVLIHFIRKSKRKTPLTDELENSPKPESQRDSGNVSIISSHGTSDQGLTSKQDFKDSNGSIHLCEDFQLSKETVI